MTRFYNVLAALAVILTPVAMIAVFGWTAYSAVLAQTGNGWIAIVSGVATAAAVESIGIVAGETALWFHGQHDRRWMTAGSILALYVLFGLVVLRGTPLGLLPVLAGAVYVLSGLRAQAQRETAAANGDAQTEREWQHEQWRIRQQDATAIKLARLQATPVPPASNVQAATNGASSHASTAIYACKQCKDTFSTMQALGAHVRHNHKEQA